jgi:hypothetical protein
VSRLRLPWVRRDVLPSMVIRSCWPVQSFLIQLSKQLPNSSGSRRLTTSATSGHTGSQNEMARTVVENPGDGCPCNDFIKIDAVCYRAAGQRGKQLARTVEDLAAEDLEVVSMCASGANQRTQGITLLSSDKITLPGPFAGVPSHALRLWLEHWGANRVECED